MDGEQAAATINSDNPGRLKDLLDAEVELTGVQSGVFDNKMQQTGILFHVQSLDQVKILKRAGVDPWSIAVTPMDRVLTGYRVRDQSERERVHGTITYYQPGVALVLQDGAKSIWIDTDSWSPLHVGDVADAIGFPNVENGFLTLARGEVRETPAQAPVSAVAVHMASTCPGRQHGHGHVFDLVSMEGRWLPRCARRHRMSMYSIPTVTCSRPSFAIPAPQARFPLNPMREVPVGTHIRVTGICMLTDANPFNGEVPFNILMRTPDDIAVRRAALVVERSQPHYPCRLAARRWWSPLAPADGSSSARFAGKQPQLAYLERRRSRILEDINGSRPLAEIIEQITEVVSFKLHGRSLLVRDRRWSAAWKLRQPS